MYPVNQLEQITKPNGLLRYQCSSSVITQDDEAEAVGADIESTP
jgi:hypothetical protein